MHLILPVRSVFEIYGVSRRETPSMQNRQAIGLPVLHTPKVTIVERSQVEIEQFLAMLRFENRKKLEELPGFMK